MALTEVDTNCLRKARARLYSLHVTAVALLAGVAMVAAAAHAQNTAGPAVGSVPATESMPLTEVVVTGSRIPQPNLTSASPIQIVTDKDIKLTGTTDMVALINTLPQQFMNNAVDFSGTSQVLASPGGLSTADLRGLGPQRTLVLVDGRRLGIGDANTGNPNPAPDLNQIPVQLVERVDVVTGGASSVYGSDAIAGVVNFILRHDFEGVEIDGQYGLDDHTNKNSFMQGLISQAGFNEPPHHVSDGYNRTVAVIVGLNGPDRKSNATAYFTYLNQDPVVQGSRDFSACKLNVITDANNVVDIPSCNGSVNSNLFQPLTGPNANNAYSVVGNTLLPYPQAGSSPPPLFNSNAYQYLLHGDIRYSGGLISHYDFNDDAKAYAELSFMNDQTTVQIGPSGAFFGGNPFDPTGSGGFQVNCNNPLLSAQEAQTLCSAADIAAGNTADVLIGRRNIEGTGRQSYFEHVNYRAVLGIKGNIVSDAWTYDAYGQYYYTTLFQRQSNYLSYTNIGNALQVSRGPGGTAVCTGTLNGSTPGCVPYNIWTTGAVTPAQLAYLNEDSLAYGTVKQEIASANVTGELGKYGIKLPTASDGIAVNVGVEHRTEILTYAPDKTAGSGDLGGGSGATPSITGSYSVREAFGEARIPLVQNLRGIDELLFETGYRRSDYSTDAGGVNTYKFALQYAPIPDIRFRGSFQRAIRAPNIIELFNPQTVTQTTVIAADPCAGPTPSASLADCAHTGVTPAQYGKIVQCPAGQCAVLDGGSAALRSEQANTTSVGFTVTPSFLTGFSGSLDYYRIDLKQEIGVVPINVDLAICLNTGNPAACSLIVRTPQGFLFGSTIAGGGYVRDINANIAGALVSGVDVQLSYRIPLSGWGSLEASLNGAWLDKDTATPIPGFTYDCTGLYGTTCGTLNPRWRHNARLSWQTPWKFLVSGQWRYIGPVALDSNNGQSSFRLINQLNNGGSFDSFDARLSSRSYFDVTAFWDVFHNVTVRAGINNVFDKNPPLVNSLVANTGAPNTYPTYDLLGRVIFVGVQARF